MADMHAAFIQAIVESPEDDTPRLVYADWLEENGEPERARHIRDHCALGRLDPDSTAWEEAFARVQAAPYGGYDRRFAEVTAVADSTWSRDGFVVRVAVKAAKLPRAIDRLFAAAPIDALTLTEVGSHMPAVAALPQLPRLRDLDLTDAEPLSAEAVAALAASPHLGGLRELSMCMKRGGPDAAVALSKAASFGQLAKLDLSETRVGDRGLIALARSDRLPSLSCLHLRSCRLTDKGVIGLASADGLPALEELVLAGHWLHHESVRALALSHRWPNLTVLDLYWNRALSHAGVIELAQAPPGRLRDLNLGATGLNHWAVAELMQAPALATVERLHLEENEFGQAGVTALARQGELPALRHLGLGDNGLGRHAVEVLAGWAGLGRLESLGLNANPIGDDGVRALVESPATRGLRHVWMTGCGLTDEGAFALAGWAAPLEALHASSNGLTERGKQALRGRFGRAAWL